MKKLLTVFVTVAFSASFVCDGAVGSEGYGQEEDEAEGNAGVIEFEELLAIGAESIGALGAGAVVGYGTAMVMAGLQFYVTGPLVTTSQIGMGAVLVAAATGYAVGVPLGAAAGASTMGWCGERGGSFWWSWAGAQLGAIAAAGLAWTLVDVADGSLAGVILALGPPAGAVTAYNLSRWINEPQATRGSFWWSCIGAGLGAVSAAGFSRAACEVSDGSGKWLLIVPTVALGPPAGAMIGYNLSRPKVAQTPENSIRGSSGRDGPELSLLVPEVELRRDRISKTVEPAYKLTLAKLSF